jgi:alpha-glucosidase
MKQDNYTQYFQSYTQVGCVSPIRRGVELEVESEKLRVEVLRDGLIRLKMSKAGGFDETPTFAVCADVDAMEGQFCVEQNEKTVSVVTSKMVLTIHKSPFWIDAHRTDGSVIFESSADEKGNGCAYSALNNEFIVERRCHRQDSFFGLGEKTGRWDRKGRDFKLWNTDILSPSVMGEARKNYPKDAPKSNPFSTEFDPYYVSIPFFYHQPYGTAAMSGFFFDNGYAAEFEFSSPECYLVHFKGGQYTEYVFAGPSMAEILEEYTFLTGRMQPPPMWALGSHQCRWHNYDQESLQNLGATYRAKNIPCDTLWLDIGYMNEYRVFTWNKDIFPEVKQMLGHLKDQGFRVITIIDPGVKVDPGYPVFDEGIGKDLFCKTNEGVLYVGQVWPGRTAFPDFSLKETRIWWGRLNAEHVESGLAGIWTDMNEPATGDISSDPMCFGLGKYSHTRYHNQYAMLMAMGTTEGLLSAMPDKRTFVLSRAGFAGIQRYAANWMGDNSSRWDHLWMSIPMAMGFSVSGQPFVGADIPGFCGEPTLEMTVRWYEYGTLTRFCRNHNAINQNDQYPWVFGEAAEELCRKAVEQRYRLLPYIYTQFMISSETGAPIQRPLLFQYQDEVDTRSLDDQYLFGGDLLVAPIVKEGMTSRQVYLPKGTWHDWHTGEQHMGQRWIVASAPLGTIPLYARGGSVIAQWPEAPATTMNHHAKTVELHVFIPDEDGETVSLLHEDDGETFQFRHGAFYRTEFTLRKNGKSVTLDAKVTGNGYSQFARETFTIVIHGRVGERVQLDGESRHLEGGKIAFANAGIGFLLTAEIP